MITTFFSQIASVLLLFIDVNIPISNFESSVADLSGIESLSNIKIDQVQENLKTSPLKQKLSKYEFYETAVKTLNKQRVLIPDTEKLTNAELEEVAKSSCKILNESKGSINESTLSKMIESPSINQLVTNPEHFGVAVAVSVYYDCEEYTDELLVYLKALQS